MVNILFYGTTVVIWGSTWIAIKLQLGEVDPMLSVGYRFSLAAVLLLLWCRVRRIPMRFSALDHGYMVLQGILLFSLNYLLFYLAELRITSGLAAVIFSTIQLMNMVNGASFPQRPPGPARCSPGGYSALSAFPGLQARDFVVFSAAGRGYRRSALPARHLFRLPRQYPLGPQPEKWPADPPANAFGMATGPS